VHAESLPARTLEAALAALIESVSDVLSLADSADIPVPSD
jgi:hypothetical protein